MAPIDTFWRLVDSATGRQRNHEPAISATTAAIVSVGISFNGMTFPLAFSPLVAGLHQISIVSGMNLNRRRSAAVWGPVFATSPGLASFRGRLIAFTSLYVLPFYLSPRTRPSPTLNRDAPSVIQARIRAVTMTVTFSTLSTFLLLTTKGHFDIHVSLHYLGLWPISPVSIIQSLCLTLTLYLGPLYNDLYLEGSLSPISRIWSQIVTSLSSSMGYRNYIAGPLTEELLFRSTILPIHLLSPLRDSPKRLVFLTPLYFGIAHIHHFYEFRLSHPDTPLTPALFRTIFQFAYTTIFGWYAAFIYLRTGNLYAVFIIHAFCNYMGLPRLWGKVSLRSSMQRPFRVAKAGSVLRSKDDTETEPLPSSSKTTSDEPAARSRMLDPRTKHTIIYYALLLIGVYGFTGWLNRLTVFEKLALVKFSR